MFGAMNVELVLMRTEFVTIEGLFVVPFTVTGCVPSPIVRLLVHDRHAG